MTRSEVSLVNDLLERNLHHVCIKIFVQLPPEDLQCCRLVSEDWRVFIDREVLASRKWSNYRRKIFSRELADLAHMLFDAAGDGDYDSVDRLLGLAPMEVGVNSRSTRDGWTPLIRAAYFGREAVVRRLLEEEDVDVNLANGAGGWTALMWAADRGHRQVISLLLKWPGTEVSYSAADGTTAYERARRRKLDDALVAAMQQQMSF